ncbi:MAG: D-TA family PLP-dependent enzyme [Treponema sp.]|nr:D-TA family PLP-dependent enzyme [Treponema sp.]
MDYHFRGEETIDSPELIYYQDIIEANIDQAIRLAGGVNRLWPHVKTHKMAAVVRMQIARRIKNFKCATIAEAEMCASCGADQVILAYPLVGPKIGRFFELCSLYTHTVFYAVGDDLEQLAELDKRSALYASGPVHTLVDVNMGMDRTGVALDRLEDFYRAAARLPNIRLAGFHCYDGHLGIADIGERRKAVTAPVERLFKIREALLKNGFETPILVMGGTPTFPCHQTEADVYLSPGTLFVHDAGYRAKYADLDFIPGAAVLTRVISRPAPDLFTVDCGYKAIASDHEERGLISGLPAARAVQHSEEHWVWRLDSGEAPSLGSILYIIPTHICPTSALYPGAQVVSGGKLVNYWDVTARNRKIRV